MLTPDRRSTLGVDVGGTFVKCIITNPDGEVVGRLRSPSHGSRGPQAALSAVLDVVSASIDAVPHGLDLAAVGIAVPGLIDEELGTILNAENLGWRDVPMRALVTERIGLPSWFGHDVFAGGVAELRHGAGKGPMNSIFLPVGTGIGASLKVNGEHITRGGLAGEIGHLDVGHDEPCACGRSGCLEAMASAAAIARRFAARTGEANASAAVVAQRVRTGDPTAIAVWDDALDALSFALSWLVGILAPDVIVVGGGLSKSGDLLTGPLHSRLSRMLSPQQVPRLVAAAFGDEAGAHGAAHLARDVLERDNENATTWSIPGRSPQ